MDEWLRLGYAAVHAAQARVTPSGLVYHVLNWAVARPPLLQKPEDYDALQRVLVEAHLCPPCESWPTI